VFPDDDDGDEEGAADLAMPDEAPEDHSRLTLDGHHGSAFCCALSPLGALVATGGEDDCARVWRLDTGALLMVAQGYRDSVTQVAFSRDGKRLAVGDMSGLIRVYAAPDPNQPASTDVTLPAGKKAWKWEHDLDTDLTWLVWHPVKTVLLAGTQDGEGWMWEGDTKMLAGHGSAWTKAAVLPDGNRLLAGYEDGSSRLFNLQTAAAVHHFSNTLAHDAAVTCVTVSGDGGLLATGCLTGVVKVYTPGTTPGTGRVLATLPCAPGAGVRREDGEDGDGDGSDDARSVEAAEFAPGEAAILATATVGGVLTLWDVSAQRARHQLSDLPGVSCLRWAPRAAAAAPAAPGARLYAGCLDGTVLEVDSRSGEVTRQMTSVVSSVMDLAVSADGKTVAAAMDDGKVRLFDVGETR